MNLLAQLDQFHKTRLGHSAVGAIELVLFYALALIAQDTANMWAYFFAIIFLVGGLVNLGQAFPFRKNAKGKVAHKK